MSSRMRKSIPHNRPRPPVYRTKPLSTQLCCSLSFSKILSSHPHHTLTTPSPLLGSEEDIASHALVIVRQCRRRRGAHPHGNKRRRNHPHHLHRSRHNNIPPNVKCRLQKRRRRAHHVHVHARHSIRRGSPSSALEILIF